jgi:hypothetical protein
MHPLIRAIPDYNLLLALEPEELAAKLLFVGLGNSLHDFLLGLWETGQTIGFENQSSSYPLHRRSEIELAIAEAWARLEA